MLVPHLLQDFFIKDILCQVHIFDAMAYGPRIIKNLGGAFRWWGRKGKYFYIIAWGQGTLAFKYSASLNLGFSYVLACLHAPHLQNSVSVITHIFPLKKPKFLPKVIQNCEIYMCSKSDRSQSWFVPGQMRFFSQVCWTFFA